jgi:hypothetical protein
MIRVGLVLPEDEDSFPGKIPQKKQGKNTYIYMKPTILYMY